MQRYKRRARILSEKLGGLLSYGQDGTLVFQHGENAVSFKPLSHNKMSGVIEIGEQSKKLDIPKKYVFDVMEKLAASHLAETLLNYDLLPVLEIADYINDEQGQRDLDELKQQLADNPSLKYADLGGNRILVQYFSGTLIISDDLLMAATNVVDF